MEGKAAEGRQAQLEAEEGGGEVQMQLVGGLGQVEEQGCAGECGWVG